MKTSYVVLFLLSAHISFGQLQENFNDGNFSSSPQWQGDTSLFVVNASGELQSHGPSTSSILQLHCPNTRFSNTEWRFYTRLEFDPSTANYAKFYLASDQPDLKNSLNGYFLKIGGETGTTDGIDLYKQQGNTVTKLIDGINGHAGKPINSLHIKVIRDSNGRWKLYADTLGGDDFAMEGMAVDTSSIDALYCGIVCVHSSTRKDLFFFDELLIQEAPLTIVNAIATSPSTIEVSFNRAIELASGVNTANYILSPAIHPVSVSISDEKDKVTLTLAQPLSNGSYILVIDSLKDMNGVLIDPGSKFSFTYKKPLQYGDLVISEIMADPSPSKGLPEWEFIEIYNASADTIYLEGFTFSDESTTAIINNGKVNPHAYIILSSSSAAAEFNLFGNTIAVSPWPSLNNSGDKVSLRDASGSLIIEVNYQDSWYEDLIKKEGGWSLEIKNPKEPCSGSDNWQSSLHPSGGTPGSINSVHSDLADNNPPRLERIIVESASSIRLIFNENLDTAIAVTDLSIDQNIQIIRTDIVDPRSVQLFLLSTLAHQIFYHVSLTNIKDCKGNKTDPALIAEFFLPEKGDSLDVVINEVLFNPLTGGSDFVEIYNKSSKIIDLHNWQLGTIKKDSLSDFRNIADSSFIIFPGQYLCLSPDPDFIEANYKVFYPNRVIKMVSFPSYNDDQGTVILRNQEENIIDRFDYNEEYHFPLINNREGISLERISFIAHTNSPYNWHSAAETAGWATPGYLNSQVKSIASDKSVSIDPKVFTPDQDSYNDLAFISYRFNEPGYIASIKIFDIKGRLIKDVGKNQILGTEGFFNWDGTNESGHLASIGYYIVFFETFNLKGEVHTFKETVVLGSKF